VTAESIGDRWTASGTWGNPVFQRQVQQRQGVDEARAIAISERLVRAQQLIRDGDYDQAARIARDAITQTAASGEHLLRADAALVLFYAGDLDGARAALHDVVRAAESEGDLVNATNALGRLGRLAFALGDVQAGNDFGVKSVAVGRKAGDPTFWASMLMGLAISQALMGEVAEAAALADELSGLDAPLAAGMAQLPLSMIDLEHNDVAGAFDRLQSILPSVRALSIDYFSLPVLVMLARCQVVSADYTGAASTLAEAEALGWSPFQEHLPDMLLITAAIARGQGDNALLHQADSRMAELSRYVNGPNVRAAAAMISGMAQLADGEAARALAQFEAAALAFERAPRYAAAGAAWCAAAEAARIADPDRVPELLQRASAIASRQRLRRVALRAEALAGMAPPAAGASPLRGLTAREAEIVRLVAAGRTNREVGEALYLSEKTVRNYLSTVFTKLGVSRRAELAALVAAE
jgi:DNA-binding NarL/FixJ family response regulator